MVSGDSSNGQIVAFTFGRRTSATFRRLKNMLVNTGISVDLWITDQWIAYQDCLIPEKRKVNKAELQSLERKHLTLRTRIKRLTRKTICFSKLETLHKTVIGLFSNYYFFGLNQHFYANTKLDSMGCHEPGCIGEFQVFNGEFNSTAEPEPTGFKLYPNPVTGGRLFIEPPAGLVLGSDAEIIIYDMFGRAVKRQAFDSAAIDVSGLSRGMYCLTIESGDAISMAAAKFIVR